MSSSNPSNFKADATPGVLILEDSSHPAGLEFSGFLFGAPVSAKNLSAEKGAAGQDKGYGEVVFNTSMTGYQEILTDPSYYGQMVCMTTPHIGNTGVNTEDPESAHPWCAGFIVHDAAEIPSSWRSMDSLDSYLKKHHIPGIYGVDTRALTRHLRSRGVVRGLILPESEKSKAAELLKKLPAFEGRDLIGEVTTKEPYRWPLSATAAASAVTTAKTDATNTAATTAKTANAATGSAHSEKGGGKYKVVALDYGVKWNMLKSLHALGCDIEVVPANTSAQAILDRKPQGVFLSNGPGDPAAAPYATETVRGLLGKVPIFGVCMGHQILSLACGAKTFKLKFGHRGGNQPVLDKDTGKVEISSQNHGYAVDDKTLPANVEVTHINLNDKTVEGIRVKGQKAFSVQYHPESCPGPHDSRELFDRFIALMDQK